MTALAIVPLAGADGATVEAALAEAGPQAAVASPAEAPGSAEILAFVRPGDRWRPGTFATRVAQLRNRPDVGIGIAAHALVDSDGREVAVVHLPPPPLDWTELVLRPAIEPATVLVRAALLDPAGLELLQRPYGDAILWSRLVRDHGVAPSWEVVADVPLDPARHGTADARGVAVLLEAASTPGEEPGLPSIRRELLRRLYLEGDERDRHVDLGALLGGGDDDGERAAAVVADLQWLADRLREALAAERVTWPTGVLRPEDQIPRSGREELNGLHTEITYLHEEVLRRDALIDWLNEEIARRDARLERLAALLPEGAGE